MSLVNLFVAARNAIKNRRQRQRAFDELMALDDRSLADIGIHRTQIPALVMSFEEAAQIEASPLTAGAGRFGRPQNLAHLHR
jgi:uncharacterized protein YjiS (DUF1127 family)